jgi:hypothetical protein
MKNNIEKEFNENQLFITPISGLELTDIVKNELKIENVFFVSKDKLPRIRKRLGLQIPISKLETKKSFLKELLIDFFKKSETYAVLNFTGDKKEKYSENIRIIEDAISLISFSNLGYSTRKFNNKIYIKKSESLISNKSVVINKSNSEFSIGGKSLHPLPFQVNNNWKSFHQKFFYQKFLKIINGEKKINRKWRNLLISAARIVGKSLNSHDIPESFLKNIIALEMLLVDQNEKIKDKLIERSAYFLDWSENWENDNIEERIIGIYKKRCDYVHDGRYSDITKEDLIFSDELIFNVFNNLINYIDKISSKAKLIEFSDNYQCEKKLGLNSKFQFGKFKYVKTIYKQIDFNEI